MWNQLKTATLMLLALTVVTGVAYPLLVNGVAQLAFPSQANGSLIQRDGVVVGSELIGQPFSDPRYFWSRPSATAPVPYNASASVGYNLGPTNPALSDAVAARAKALRDADPGNPRPVPVDLVTASGSGLDPHISPAAAAYQAGRVARLRQMDPAVIATLIASRTERRQFGFLGEPRVNVLALNLALQEYDEAQRPGSPETDSRDD